MEFQKFFFFFKLQWAFREMNIEQFYFGFFYESDIISWHLHLQAGVISTATPK